MTEYLVIYQDTAQNLQNEMNQASEAGFVAIFPHAVTVFDIGALVDVRFSIVMMRERKEEQQ